MPDDSDPNFKAEQSRHAADARIIREVSRHSNVPANQIRQAMRNGSLVTGQQSVQVAGQIPRPDLRPPAPLDVSRTRNFDPRPFKPEPAPVGGQAPQAPVGGTKQVIIVDNGTANFYNIVATFISAV